MTGAVVYGFISGGSPWEARNKKFDQTRLTNLREIKYAVETYTNKNNNLPQNLSQIKEYLYGAKSITDPETGAEYEYKIVNPTSYQICATFTSDPPADNSNRYSSLSYSDDFGKYKKGNYCFDLNTTIPYNYSSPNPSLAPFDIPRSRNDNPQSLDNDPNSNKNVKQTVTNISDSQVEVSKVKVYSQTSLLSDNIYDLDVICPSNYDIASITCSSDETNRPDVTLESYESNTYDATQHGAYCSFNALSPFKGTIKVTCDKNYANILVKTPEQLAADVSPVTSNKFQIWTQKRALKTADGFQSISIQCPKEYKIKNINCGIFSKYDQFQIKFIKSEIKDTPSGQENICFYKTEGTFDAQIRAICEK